MEELNYEETTKSLNELLRSIQRSYVKDTTKDRAPAFYQAPFGDFYVAPMGCDIEIM